MSFLSPLHAGPSLPLETLNHTTAPSPGGISEATDYDRRTSRKAYVSLARDPFLHPSSYPLDKSYRAETAHSAHRVRADQ